ncbi:hypothetical protein M758_UG132700 [Ceratodon purpureus]|nr:hypothetical protein M758_UG132700 [Ceratodon purpureus]
MARGKGPLPRRLYNPFPRQPRGLQFVRGDLHFDATRLTSRTLSAGKSFFVSWDAHLGRVSVHHRNLVDRALWATPRHGCFVSAALGESSVHESHGSYSLNDKVELLLTHQNVEDIAISTANSSNNSLKSSIASEQCKASAGRSVCFGTGEVNSRESTSPEVDPDGMVVDGNGDVVVVSGCLYSTCKLAREELRDYHEGKRREDGSPFHEEAEDGIDEGVEISSWFGEENGVMRVGVRYRLVFSEKRENQLGFHVELDLPMRKRGDATSFFTKSVRFVESANGWDWISKNRLSGSRAFNFGKGWEWRYGMGGANPLRRVMSLSGFGSSEEEEVVNVPRLNRVLLTYASHARERFFGFGEQFSFFDLKGRRVPIMVQEQGLGRGDQPITAAANLVAYRAAGDWHTTYAPSPHYLTSDINSLYLEGYEHSVFDLTQRDCVQVQVHAGSMKGRILYGQTPPELIKEYTAAVGRMRALPAWITKGAIVGMQGGHDAVREVWRKVREYDVPLSAFWLQDWVGKRKTSVGWQLWWNWEVDRDHYPGWEELISDLRASGVRTMAYCNPFIVSTDEKPNRRKDLFTVAKNEGYVVPDAFGAPYMIPITSFEATMLDLTNPETRRWFKGLLYDMVKTGVRGWMADFGESLPFDSCLHSGEDPATAHNRYPEMWVELNREFVEEWEQEQRAEKQKLAPMSLIDPKPAHEEGNLDDEDDGDELVFFMRAGYRGSPRWATLFWEGDQMVSWQRNDGIKSAVTGLLSSGVSGYAFNHSDIGGYCTVDLPFIRYSRSEELLLRWMELNAFSAIFRTHEGNVPSANAQFYSNDTTLRHFARCARIFQAWEFYRRQLVKEAAAVGMPVVRHLFLHYPDDQYVQTIVYQQFLVGSEILVVPVLDKGHTQVQAYFPSGDIWEHIWTGDLYKAPNKQGLKVWVQAPLGFPAVFVKRGSWVGQQFMHNLVKEKLKVS